MQFISKKNYNKVLKLGQKIHNLLKCRGVTRSDFKFSNNKFYLLEINTQPGMTDLSLVPEISFAGRLWLIFVFFTVPCLWLSFATSSDLISDLHLSLSPFLQEEWTCKHTYMWWCNSTTVNGCQQSAAAQGNINYSFMEVISSRATAACRPPQSTAVVDA